MSVISNQWSAVKSVCLSERRIDERLRAIDDRFDESSAGSVGTGGRSLCWAVGLSLGLESSLESVVTPLTYDWEYVCDIEMSGNVLTVSERPVVH